MYEKMYILNYTPKYIHAYTYTFFFLCTEFHVARMQTKFYPNFTHHTAGWAGLIYNILYQQTSRVFVWPLLTMSIVHSCKQAHSFITLTRTPPAVQCADTVRCIPCFSIPMQLLSDIFFASVKYLLSFGINNHTNICGSSSYMSVILSDFIKNCTIWANLNANSNLKFY
jgi:hypothetical protein